MDMTKDLSIGYGWSMPLVSISDVHSDRDMYKIKSTQHPYKNKLDRHSTGTAMKSTNQRERPVQQVWHNAKESLIHTKTKRR